MAATMFLVAPKCFGYFGPERNLISKSLKHENCIWLPEIQFRLKYFLIRSPDEWVMSPTSQTIKPGKFQSENLKTKTKTISQTNIIKTPHTSLKPKHSLLIINISFTTNTNQQQYAKQMHNHLNNHWPIQTSIARLISFPLKPVKICQGVSWQLSKHLIN